jgi:hypothetical protein
MILDVVSPFLSQDGFETFETVAARSRPRPRPPLARRSSPIAIPSLGAPGLPSGWVILGESKSLTTDMSKWLPVLQRRIASFVAGRRYLEIN